MSLNRFDIADSPHRHALAEATLLYISSSRYEADWHSILHSHGFTEIFYVVGGAGKFLVEDSSFPVAEGDLVIVEPGTEHTETSISSTPLEYIALGVDGFTLPAQEDSRPWRHLSFRQNKGDILTPLRFILQETQEQAVGYEQVCQGLLSVVLIRLARRVGFPASNVRQQTASRESTAARRYINNHYRENLTLDTLAEAVHISKYHLSHTFSREYGISPISYMLQLRLQECRELLRTTDYSVAQVARMTGFSSPSYFSQRFRAAEGMTPVAYRQKYAKSRNENMEDTL